MFALREKCRSRRVGRFKRRGVFLPDMPRRGEAATRVGAGPVDVVATRVAAAAIERVRENAGTVRQRAEDSTGSSSGGVLYPGTLDVLAAIDTIRHAVAPFSAAATVPRIRRGTRQAMEPPARADQRPRLVASVAPPRGGERRRSDTMTRGRAIAPGWH